MEELVVAFSGKMLDTLESHKVEKGDSWRTCSGATLLNRAEGCVFQAGSFDEHGFPPERTLDKIIDAANLLMMAYYKLNQELLNSAALEDDWEEEPYWEQEIKSPVETLLAHRLTQESQDASE
jgi:hypothetical protein